MAMTCRQSAAGSGGRRAGRHQPPESGHALPRQRGTTSSATLRAVEGSSGLFPKGTGAEMRAARGVAVFSGMIGVTRQCVKPFRAWPFTAETLTPAFNYNRAPYLQSFVEVRVEGPKDRVRLIPHGVSGPFPRVHRP